MTPGRISAHYTNNRNAKVKQPEPAVFGLLFYCLTIWRESSFGKCCRISFSSKERVFAVLKKKMKVHLLNCKKCVKSSNHDLDKCHLPVNAYKAALQSFGYEHHIMMSVTQDNRCYTVSPNLHVFDFLRLLSIIWYIQLTSGHS